MPKPTKTSNQSQLKELSRRYKLQFLFFVSLAYTWIIYHQQQLLLLPSSTGGWTPTVVVKNEDVCNGYDGVLHIRQGDAGCAALTCLFVYPINQIIYAEMHNLLPWIHFDNTSHLVYDSQVHGTFERSFAMRAGVVPDLPYEEACDDCYERPGIPYPDNTTMNVTIRGNGVFNSYFEPLNAFHPTDNPCQNKTKPLYNFDYEQVATGIHLDSIWAVRTWDYGTLGRPSDMDITMKQWYRLQRLRAAKILKQYFRVQPWILERAEQANPLQNDQRCLAMHVRTTDKVASGGRGLVALKKYLPYAQAFVEYELKAGRNEPILYLATDSKKVVKQIKKEWPKSINKHVRVQENIVRSNSKTPVFDLVDGRHHQTNTEVLVDMYAMTKCVSMVHGRSAVSEAVMYVNPELIDRTVDLEDRKSPISVKIFKKLL